MLHQHVVDEGGTLELGARPQLDRPPEQHDAGGPPAPRPHQRAKRHRLACPTVRNLWDVLGAELDVTQLVLPMNGEPLDQRDHEVVELLGSVVSERWVRGEWSGQHDRPPGTATMSVACGTGARPHDRKVVRMQSTSHGTHISARCGRRRDTDISASTMPGGGKRHLYGRRVSRRRACSRSTCGRAAIATLTYVYSDQTAVLGPLATYAEPHAYDLCDFHADRLSVPRGWEVIRLSLATATSGPTEDDLLALADAVREAGRPRIADEPLGQAVEAGRRGHLRMLNSTDA